MTTPLRLLTRPQLSTAALLYGTVNVVLRGGLAVLGIIGAHDLGWSAGTTAALVAYATLAMRFGRVLIAPFMSGGSVRTATALGMVAASGGFLLLTHADVEALAWLGVSLLGVGYGAVVLSIKVAMVRDRPRRALAGLGLLAIALNVGAAVGPLLSGLVQASYGGRVDFALLAGISLAGAAVALLLPSDRATAQARLDAASVRLLLDRRVLYLVALLAVAFCFYAQLYATLPLLVHARADSDAILGGVFALNAVVVIGLQMPVSALAARHEPVARYGPALGLGVFAVSFVILARTDTVRGLLLATAVASAAECLLLPLIEAELAQRLGPQALTAAFTLSAIGMGVGESAGSYAGVRFALAGAPSTETFLLVLAAASCCAALWDGVMAHQRRRPDETDVTHAF